MKKIPTKRCDRIDRHPEEHIWMEGPFARRCPGRTTTKERVRGRRKPKN